MLKPGGILALSSPFTWMEEYTDKRKWIGATYSPSGEPQRSGDALKSLLGGMGYTVLEEGSIPLVIRETAHKYQMTVAHKLVVQKKQE